MTKENNQEKNKSNLDNLINKLRQHLTNEEIQQLSSNQEEIINRLLLSIARANEQKFTLEKPVLENENRSIQNKEKSKKEILETLINNHLSGVAYHVFQWLDLSMVKNDSGFELRNYKYADKRGINGAPPFENIKNQIFSELNLDLKQHQNLEEYLREHKYFIDSNAKEARIGRIFIASTEGKSSMGIVLIQGSFSTESASNRFGGRTNIDNQIVWLFDNLESAQTFVNLFNESVYQDDSKDVEENTKIIEEAFKIMKTPTAAYGDLEARLLLGQEVKKLN